MFFTVHYVFFYQNLFRFFERPTYFLLSNFWFVAIFVWLVNLISSSTLIVYLNKHQLVEMLRTVAQKIPPRKLSSGEFSPSQFPTENYR